MKKFLTLFALLSVVFLGACEDFIDLSPKDVIDQSKAYQTAEDINKGTIGALDAIPNTIATNAIMTDNVKLSVENRGQNLTVWRHLITEGDGEIGGFFSYYITIDRVNRVLEAIDGVKANHPDDATIIDSYKGELLGIRAYAHFQILAAYADFRNDAALAAPYMEKSEISSPARITVAEYVAKLNADINEALSLLPADYAEGDATRFSRYAVIATQARLALYRENWQAAVDASTTLINEFPLNSLDTYLSLWSDDDHTEVIFAQPRATSSDGAIGTTFTDLNGDVFFNGGYGVYDLFGDDDLRKEYFFLIDTSNEASNQLLVNKYNHREGQLQVADVKFFRVSEFYLTRAEAYAELNNLDAAAADIEALRAQRIAGAGTVSYSTSQAALNDIYTERRKELLYEGHRFFDLKRWDLPLDRDNRDFESDGISDGFSADSHLWLIPIPFAEILANDNMVQNPGYQN